MPSASAYAFIKSLISFLLNKMIFKVGGKLAKSHLSFWVSQCRIDRSQKITVFYDF